MALVLSRDGPAQPDGVDRMLAAAPHRGRRRRVEVLGKVAVGVSNDPDWETAAIARGDGRIAVFSGSLDNATNLRRELRDSTYLEQEDPDPACILLAAADRWGSDAVRRFRGSLAGAVTDGRTLWCFRDQFGAHPLFCHNGSGGFYAATEVKQVLAGAPIRREPDMEHLHGIIFGGIERSTAYRGVERIPTRSVVTAGPEPGLEERVYWDPSVLIESADLDPDQAAAGIREHLRQAVQRVLTGRDVVLLSGGLDSPALAAFAGHTPDGGGPAQALTAVYPDHPSVDEKDWTRLAAEHTGLALHEFAPDAGSLDDVEYWVEVLDGPVDVLSIPEMAQSYRAARDLGARTVLNGEIAEFLFENRMYLLDHYLAHGRFEPLFRYVRDLRAKGWSRRQLALELLLGVAPTKLAAAYVRRNSKRPPGLPRWVDLDTLRDSRSHDPAWTLSSRKRWPRLQVSILRGPAYAFEASDICASVCGVESRRPFADVDLWEFVLSLPAEVKFPNRRTKPLLRKAMRGVLPDRLIDRTDKTYFDEYHLDHADYSRLRRLLVDTPAHLEGIDYGQLRDDLRAEDMEVPDLQWARDLARVHAFLEQF